MPQSPYRCIGWIGIAAGIVAIIGLVIKIDFITIGGIIAGLAASFWLAFLVKPQSDQLRDDARAEHKTY